MWDDISDQLNDKLQTLQNRATRVITGADYRIPISDSAGPILNREETNSSHDVQNYEWYSSRLLTRYLHGKYREISLFIILESQGGI